MNITFYTFSKRVNSTARPSGGTAYAVVIKDGSGIVSPSISLKWSGSGSPVSFNYAYILDWGRYYWVSNWTYFDRQWTADLRVDVLASYKTQIGASNQYVVRAASAYDESIVDGLYPATCYAALQESHTNIWPVTDMAPADQTFIVSTMSGQGFQQYFLMSGLQYAYFASKVFGSALWNGYDFGDLTEDTIKALASPEDNLVNVQWLPIRRSSISSNTGAAVTQVPLGLHIIDAPATQISPVDVWSSGAKTLALTTHPQTALRGKYLNSNTFTDRTLYIPGVGTIPLDSDLCIDCDKVTVSFQVNLASGDATCMISTQGGEAPDYTKNNLQGVYHTKLSIDFGYGTTRVNGLGIVQGIMDAVGAGVKGDALGTASGVVNALQSAMPRSKIINSTGAIGAYQFDMHLREVYYRVVDEDLADRGRPLCKVRQLSTLAGYIKCEDATLQMAATEAELSEALSYLNGGFFYE